MSSASRPSPTEGRTETTAGAGPVRRRNRHGRSGRGPAVLPGDMPAPLPLGRGPHRTRSERFDDLVLDVADALVERWTGELADVEWAVEDVPRVEADADEVPLTRLLPAQPGEGPDEAGTPPRVVVFRRPLELRARDRDELAALLHTVVVERVAELLRLPPEDVDPAYDPGDEPRD
ncbi:metallopeptidase family protein [Nocardioides bruguierae]|uniref:Metallopeptidase family protein n=1 Tax=Nocardioides bruguierae TaxID=2945102 RepID=A0A9X2D4R3_9ACTN|nr:metallopeptidase family protein [Nocardioides bruguierae]MCM0619377.1 metallopeptidase family protein [Nocardioides bruguierae]